MVYRKEYEKEKRLEREQKREENMPAAASFKEVLDCGNSLKV